MFFFPSKRPFEFVSSRCFGALLTQDHFKVNSWLEAVQIKQKYEFGPHILESQTVVSNFGESIPLPSLLHAKIETNEKMFLVHLSVEGLAI